MKKLNGKVVGLKNKKTATVQITTIKLHPKYHKPVKHIKKFQVHNDKYELTIGDTVSIINCKPYSATKHFIVIDKL